MLKTEYELFQEKQYDLSEIKNYASLNSLIVPKSKRNSCKYCNYCTLSFLLIVLVLVITYEIGPLSMFLDY